MVVKTQFNFRSVCDILVEQAGIANTGKAAIIANQIFREVREQRNKGNLITVETLLVPMVDKFNNE